jgi:hypothetical protein
VAAPWTPREDQILREKHANLGAKCMEISKFLRRGSGIDVMNR